jgi:hypothetical protein
VFIEGAYCGVDQYQINKPDDDLDEGIKVMEHLSWFKNKSVIWVYVSFKGSLNVHIVLTLKFAHSIC